VHEYGHVFTGRMGGLASGSTYYGMISLPPVTGFIADSSGDFVLGNRTDPNSGNPDWTRGQRGWGSAASTPPAIPCNFQQNAYTVNDWEASPVVTPPTIQTERDEAAADMFLNWVYSTAMQGGFHNYNYIGITTCGITPTPDFTRLPGDARYNFMVTVVMPTLSTRVPTPTIAP
jgi:hypothetical protein